MSKLPKIVVVLGPTASGKTDLGIFLAKKFNGEIISADSRQVYKKMDIGTAKPEGVWQGDAYMVEGVPHYMLDIIDPDTEFSLADYKKQVEEKIADILNRGKLPIIVGGTGLYIWSIVDNLDIPKVAPNKELRDVLEKKDLEDLVEQLKKEDPETVTKIDLKNPRRVVRALEVAILSKDSFVKQRNKYEPKYEVLQIGLNWSREELNEKINIRVEMMIKGGLVDEVKELEKEGYDWKLPSMSGIGYKQIGYYLRGEMSLPEAVELLKKDTRRYAKRQMTWFKRGARINWVEKKDVIAAEQLIQKFLS